MPIFEYVCRDCEHRFEAILLGAQTPKCPKCEGRKLDQQLSRFAVGGEKPHSGENGGGACGSCGDPRGPGACSLDDVN